MQEVVSLNRTHVQGPANGHYERGTLSMKGSIYDRGTTGGNYSEWRRYPKGVRANAAGSISLVNLQNGTCPFVLAANQELLYKWKAFTDSSAVAGSSTLDNFVIIWD